MQKIPTLFVRDSEDRAHVTREVMPECQWVIDGEGVATRKYDGTCVMFDGDRWWARREVKPGKSIPINFVAITLDGVTGKTMGWEPIEQSGFARWHVEALDVRFGVLEPGTYELIGPKINGNPEGAPFHILVRHTAARPLNGAPRTFDALRDYLAERPDMEGIVWHHPAGRMCKLKRKDFA